MDTKPIGASSDSVEETREAILRRFENWLDEALAEEEPPPGLAAELQKAILSGGPLPPIKGSADLHTLWSSVTALTQEVRLQSRAFRQMSGALAQLPAVVAERIRQDFSSGLVRLPEKEEEAAEEAPETAPEDSFAQRPERQQIDLLIDLRDRLERGLNSMQEAWAAFAAGAGTGWWTRRFRRSRAREAQTEQVLAALKKGYTLTLDRLDQSLQDYHVSPIVCQGQTFDAHSMTAVEVEETDAVPEGTVVGVYRGGYEWKGQLYRPAQVKVAKAKSGRGAS
jgi:molecular chaperone GrpE